MIFLLFCLIFQSFCVIALDDFPQGHLQPLGNQRLPSVPIDEFTLDTAPIPQQFYEEYVKPSRAAIFRNVLKDAKGFKVWSDEYIRENYGEMEVRLEGKKEKGGGIPIGEKYLGRDTLRHFIDNYRSPNSTTYIVSELPEPMFKEAGVIPSVGACGEMMSRFVEIDLWWSSGGSRSVIHKDAFNQINCLYRGTKYWKLFEYKYEKWLYKHPESTDEIGGFSDINVGAVDLFQHPDMVKVPWSNFTINAGDCLFVPKSYYHQVDSVGPINLAVSILFGRMDGKESIDTSDCHDEIDYKSIRYLSDFDVMWKWAGKGVMSMGYGDFEENYRKELIELANERDITTERINEMKLEMIGERLSFGDMDKAFSYLDLNDDGKITISELKEVNRTQLAKFALEIEVYEPSNTYDFEYSYVSYDFVLAILKQVLKFKESFSRNYWIKVYQRVSHGTKEFANEIFTGLAGSEDNDMVYSKDVTTDVIKHALRNWLRYWVPQYSPSGQHLENGEMENNRNVQEVDDGVSLGYGVELILDDPYDGTMVKQNVQIDPLNEAHASARDEL
ncbi:uncharacterized protein LOC143450411 [Clavelina lepadiformis]|uniref:uncharacterized protein LOC143450411 n=1 Tax=Clavelina lepadiformis TaxID=159417 RepID=UPI00404342BA